MRYPDVQIVLAAVFAIGCAAGLPSVAAPPANSLAQIQRQLVEREYWASENDRGLQAPNRAHRLRTYFEADGIRIVDRAKPASSELLGLRLEGWGRAGALAHIGAGAIRHANERVEIDRPGVVEWFVNGPQGLEHGFTVNERPEGNGALLFRLAAEAACARLSGDAVLLTTAAGRTLRYGKLVARDAHGRVLGAHFEVPTRDRVQLVIADADAVYPVTIDPLITDAADAQIGSYQSSAELGASLASAGDVNGDGYSDVIIGAPYYDAGETDEGAVFLYLGSATGIASGGPADAAAQLEGDQPSAAFGISVSSAGDVNGDGYGDVIVGAYSYDAGETGEGAAFLYLGRASGIPSGGPTGAAARFESDQALAELGFSVSSAGDVNGDGYDDVIVGARYYDAGESNEGAAFVYHGSASGISGGGPAIAAARIESNRASSFFGISVSSAGDVNSDGYGDVIVGAFYYAAGQTDEGAAFVYHGSATGIATGGPSVAAALLQGDETQAYLGYSVSSAGDVDGDGYGDVIVGAYGHGNPDDTYEGAAYVYRGSASGVASGGPSVAAAKLEAEDASQFFGESVSSAGDVNGDGYGDVIVGAPLYPFGSRGAAFVYLGGPTGIASGGLQVAALRFEWNQTQGQLGASVAGAGDVNGDGYDDVLVGGRFSFGGGSREGVAFVIHGGAAISGTPPGASTHLAVDELDSDFGFSVSSAGDVNGDGYQDVIVGVPRYDAGQTDEGAAFVYLGSASGVASGGPAIAATRLESDQAGAEFGHDVSSAGDVNGDGYGDVVVGAWKYNGGQPFEGAAFVYLGSASGIASGGPAVAAAKLESNETSAWLGTAVSSAGDVNADGFGDLIVGGVLKAFVYHGSASGVPSGALAAAQLQSDQSGSNFGQKVAAAGDVNGDGYGDVIVGASFYNAGVVREGAAFVYLGSASGIPSGAPSVAAARLESDQGSAELGHSVSSAGDVNGDGYDDVIVGARLYDAGESNEGAAFVYLGSTAGIASGGPAVAATRLEGNQASSEFGYSVASGGDLNGDGYGDVLVGAFRYDAGDLDEGAVFAYLGSAAGIANGGPSAAAAQRESDEPSGWLGYRVAPAGDVDGDGRPEIIVGSPNHGAAFVYDLPEPSRLAALAAGTAVLLALRRRKTAAPR